jgi:organic radical activating enzyme
MKLEYEISPIGQPFPDLELVKENISKFLDNHVQDNGTIFNILFTGHEPTEWPDFLSLCKYLKETYLCTLEINTTAAPGVIWWSAAARVLDIITISAYHKTLKKVKTRKLADYLFDLDLGITIDVFIDPLEFEKCTDIIDYLKEGQRNWVIVAKPILTNNQFVYEEKQRAYFDNPTKQPVGE